MYIIILISSQNIIVYYNIYAIQTSEHLFISLYIIYYIVTYII
jgi:hypothetical protein